MTQSNNSKIQTRPIEDLIGRIRTLRQKGERQIVIPAKEADQLADSVDTGDDTYGHNTGRDHRGTEDCQGSTDC